MAACWSRRPRVPPLATTTVSAWSSASGGHAWTRRSAPCGCCGGQDPRPFTGQFYSTAGIDLRPRPAQAAGPPIWIASWGSEAGLRRVARLGDGWLASAYNTTPALFAEALTRLNGYLAGHGKDPEVFPNALATMWLYITENSSEADQIFRHRVIPRSTGPRTCCENGCPLRRQARRRAARTAGLDPDDSVPHLTFRKPPQTGAHPMPKEVISTREAPEYPGYSQAVKAGVSRPPALCAVAHRSHSSA